MRTIRFAAYLFYRYYSTGPTKDIPYASVLCALAMLLGLHIFQFLVLFDKINWLPTSTKNTRLDNFLLMAVCIAPIFLLMALLIRKSDLQKMNYEDNQIKRGNILLIGYIVGSIALLIFIILLKKGKL